jgi:hypothetical protein
LCKAAEKRLYPGMFSRKALVFITIIGGLQPVVPAPPSDVFQPILTFHEFG